MYKPLVSVVIPVYNGSDYMKEAIDSAIAQTYDNIEIIVVNDGSTDNGKTEKIALSYGDKIKYYKKENGGCASALNFGISKMNGEYFSWLSHDDVYLPDKIKKQVDCINENNLDRDTTVISCESYVINAEGKTMRKTNADYKGLISDSKAFEKNILGKCFNGCALLIPKKVLDKTGVFSTHFVFILDWEYWIRIALNGYSYYCLEEHLVKNRRHNNQVSVKKQELHDSEIDEIVNTLCNKLCEENYSPQYLKVLFFYCTILGKTELSNMLKYILRQEKKISFADEIKAQLYVIRKKMKNILRVVYHKLVLGLKR